MSLLIAIVILVLLMWTELFTSHATTEIPSRIAAVCVVTMLVPMFAAFQIRIARWRHRACLPATWLPRLHWIMIFHGLVWATAAMLIASVLQWPVIVKQLPIARSIPGLDDVIILCPILFSLAASWAIFIFGSPANGLSATRCRRKIYSLWLRMRLLLVAAPILLAFFVFDLLRMFLKGGTDVGQLTSGNLLLVVPLAIVVLVAIAVAYPWLLLTIWKTRPAGEELVARVDRLFIAANCRPRKVRIWSTGRNVANAAVIGVFPRTEVLLLSDLMLEVFPEEQLDAIVLHEIGHLKQRHALKRILFISGPLLLLMLDQQMSFGLHAAIAGSGFLATITGFLHPYLLPVGYVVYLLLVSRFRFRNMEFEADQFAAEAAEVEQLAAALERFDAISPQRGRRASGFHPAIHDRIAALERAYLKRVSETDDVAAVSLFDHLASPVAVGGSVSDSSVGRSG